MKTLLLTLLTLLLATTPALAQPTPSLVLIEGGPFMNTHANFHTSLPSFYLGRFDVTQAEWRQTMGTTPSRFTGDDLPVEMVSWYDAIEYCNQRSRNEHLQPVYTIDKSTRDPNNHPDPHFGALDDQQWTVTPNPHANGYRLPTDAEWEYAAQGGRQTRNFLFAGSDSVDEVAWYWKNSGDTYLTGFWSWPRLKQNRDRTRPVGSKKPNELGLFDMSGNVRQWCWDWFAPLPATPNPTSPAGPTSPKEGSSRTWRGGGWIGDASFCATPFRGSLAANGRGPDQGFRIARNT